MENNQCVYIHKNKCTKEVFYVGIGTVSRPYSLARHKTWHEYVANNEYEVEILHENISLKDACIIEGDLINKYGRRCINTGTLFNIHGGKLINLECDINVGRPKVPEQNKHICRSITVSQENFNNIGLYQVESMSKLVDSLLREFLKNEQ
jgi:hypothetical protein